MEEVYASFWAEMPEFLGKFLDQLYDAGDEKNLGDFVSSCLENCG